ncbi:MAG: 50S ribosomal protein L7ae [Candidatus Lokiarchaeota archaeon]|nr:50S ribosomal protein L7ae [Candidatus Lokiarchaeota archaeon]MBD3337707.1 50S ribosomal protein L7ae [Candidatus Lokiarchaeota archaeon]
MSFVKFKITDDLKKKIKRTLSIISEKRDSKIRKGMNEVTKSIERGQAKFVVMAEDVSPPEILYHVPVLCEEKSIPYAYLSTKKELGSAVNINVSSSSVAIEKAGSGNEKELDELIKQIKVIKK